MLVKVHLIQETLQPDNSLFANELWHKTIKN